MRIIVKDIQNLRLSDVEVRVTCPTCQTEHQASVGVGVKEFLCEVCHKTTIFIQAGKIQGQLLVVASTTNNGDMKDYPLKKEDVIIN